MSVCLCVCVSFNNSGTAGPIWLQLGHEMVLGQKNPDLGTHFSENPEKPILAENYKTFLAFILEKF